MSTKSFEKNFIIHKDSVSDVLENLDSIEPEKINARVLRHKKTAQKLEAFQAATSNFKSQHSKGMTKVCIAPEKVQKY